MAKEMEAIIAIAGQIEPSLQKSIAGVEKKLGGLGKVAATVDKSLAAIGGAAIAATGYLANLGTNYDQAAGDLAASTGLAGDELAKMEDVLKGVYKNNYGESFEDVADGLSQVYRNTGLVGDELQKVTEAGYVLSDTFGYDLSESSRAAKALMTNFGISGERAMDLIASGAQNGLDFSGELLDSISEYSVQFDKVGLDADAMFNIMQAGAESGAWNLDKVGDAIKEFSIRSIDGSKGTTKAFEALGLDAEKTMATFAKGGAGAEKAFKEVTKKLIEMDDEVARDAAGVALFGTMWEDLGVDAVKAMSEATDAAYGTKGAIESMADVKYENLGSALQGIKRQLETALLPAAESVSQAFLDQVPKIQGFIEQVTPAIEEFGKKIGPALSEGFDKFTAALQWMVDNQGIVIPAISGIAGAFAAFKIGTFVKDAGGLVGILSSLAGGFAFLTNPIFWVAVAIGAVIAAGVWLYQNWETVKQKASELGAWLSNVWASIKTACSNTWNSIKTWISNTWNSIRTGAVNMWTSLVSWLSGIWNSIVTKASTMATNVRTKISTGFSQIRGIVSNIWNGIVSTLTGIWNNIKTKATEMVNNVKTTISNGFSTLGSIMSAPFNAVMGVIDRVKTKVGGLIDKINGMTGLNISIPGLATGGFTQGLTFAGEDPRYPVEAVISFNPAHREENLSYWAQAGRMLGADAADFGLTGGGTSATYIDLGGVTFAPQITVKGNARKDDILAAIRESYPEFLDMLDELISEREATVYA